MKPVFIANDSVSLRTHCFSVLALILVFLHSSISLAAGDETTKAVRRDTSEPGVKGQKRVALVIGNNQYKEAP